MCRGVWYQRCDTSHSHLHHVGQSGEHQHEVERVWEVWEFWKLKFRTSSRQSSCIVSADVQPVRGEFRKWCRRGGEAWGEQTEIQ